MESIEARRFQTLIGLAACKRAVWGSRYDMPPDHLHKRDPDCNMARFYRVDVQPTLFGEASVARSWGRIGTAGRTAFETCPTHAAAEAAAAKTIYTKLKRGYFAA